MMAAVGANPLARVAGSWTLAWGPRAAVAALGFALAAQMAWTGWRIFEAFRPASPVTSAPAAARAEDRPAAILQTITNARLFGAPPEAATASAAAVVDDLYLVGTIAGTDPRSGLAIIGRTAQTARVVAVGSPTAEGFVVREVYADHVMLADPSGSLVTVKLKRDALGGSAVPAALASTSLPRANSVVETLVTEPVQSSGDPEQDGAEMTRRSLDQTLEYNLRMTREFNRRMAAQRGQAR